MYIDDIILLISDGLDIVELLDAPWRPEPEWSQKVC